MCRIDVDNILHDSRPSCMNWISEENISNEVLPVQER